MKKNLGTPDRVVRLVLAAIAAYLYYSGTVTGTFGLVLVIATVIFLITSVISFCPLYAIFGINTCPIKKS
ncbi:YgaP family membrane protein [Fontibacter flavus]|uniref:DUF2892 domain-containing protein n=1 Tax=Fontibacter flavus TaxID=654838 RepID=A0ABV6FUW2_9BACT